MGRAATTIAQRGLRAPMRWSQSVLAFMGHKGFRCGGGDGYAGTRDEARAGITLPAIGGGLDVLAHRRSLGI